MSDFSNRVSQLLHDEHQATTALLSRLEQFIARNRRGEALDLKDGTAAKLLADLSASLETEVQRHFAFEEQSLFGYLAALGEEAIGAHLTDEHTLMRPLSVRVAGLAREAMAHGLDAAQWQEFCRLGSELSQRLLAHIQKEEMALLPLIEENMDAETESRLAQEFLETV